MSSAERDSAPSPLARAGAWALAHPAAVSAAAALLAQVNTFRNQPVLDDGWVIFDNPLVRNIANVGRIFRDPYNVAGAATNAGLWRPVTTITYAFNYLVGGSEVAGYHAVNALLHVAVTVLVAWLARRVVEATAPSRASAAALGAGLVFAVHPAHVEAVAGLVGRAEILAALFALLAVRLAATRDEGRGRLAAAGLAMALGVMSKENAAIAPALFLLLAFLVPKAAGLAARPEPFTPAGRAAVLRLVLPLLAMGAGVMAALALRPGRLGVSGAAAWFAGRPPGVVAATMSRAFAEYLRVLAWPHPLGVDFYYAMKIPFTAWGDPASLVAAVAWGSVLLVGFLSWRMAPVRALGILWVFVALLPVSNILPTGVLMAERLLYLPSVGFAIWMGHGAAFLAEEGRRRSPALGRVVVAAGLAVLATFLVVSLARNEQWRNTRTLWEAEVRTTPRDPVVNNNLAVAYTGSGEYARARERLEVALEVAPGYWRAWVNLGIVEWRTGNLAAALQAFSRASAIDRTASSPHYFAGLALADAGRAEEAEARLAQAVRLAPEDLWARFHHGEALLRLGRRAEARAEYQRALELDPRSSLARRRLQEIGSAGVVDSPPSPAPAGATPR